MTMETRQINSEFKVDSRTVEGYAACFNEPSVNIGWIEVIHRGAITNETIINSDVTTLEDAMKIDPEIKVGETIEEEVKAAEFGRVAAATAKQVIKRNTMIISPCNRT